jgi:hypothetical protein
MKKQEITTGIGKPFENIGILITSHPKQQKFWQQAFASWAGFPGYMLMGYDDDNREAVPLEDFMPPITDFFLTKYKAGYLGHFRGELEQLKRGGKILEAQGVEYFYKSAADNCCYRWRNIPKLHKVLKKFDLLICGTTQMFGKVSALNKVMELWHEKLRSGGAELYVYSQIRAHELNVKYEKGPFWNDVLGLVHVQGELALNQGTNVMRTWIGGEKWTPDFKHRDLTPKRLDFYKETEFTFPNEDPLRKK